MSEPTIRVGIIGVGWWAVYGHLPQLKQDKRVTIVAICRRDERLLAEAAKLTGARNTYTDWRKMLEREKLDAVLVCTPHDYHLEPTVAALERNIHVLVEKPMTLSTKDAKAMIAAARASKAHLMAGYKYRTFPVWREVRRLIREGAIGRLRHINTVSFCNHMTLHDPSKITTGAKRWIESSGPVRPFFEDIVKAGNWRGDPLRNGGGYFVDGETHSIDRMLWLAGAPAAEVSCLLTKDGFPAERALTVHAALSNGVLLSYAFTNGVDADQLNFAGGAGTTIAGDSGVILQTEGLLDHEGGRLELVSGGQRREIRSDKETGGPAGMFIDLVASGGENPAPPEECAWTVALTEAAYKSADEGRIVRPEL